MSAKFDAWLAANPQKALPSYQTILRDERLAWKAKYDAEPGQRIMRKAREIAKERGIQITGASHLTELGKEAATILGIRLI